MIWGNDSGAGRSVWLDWHSNLVLPQKRIIRILFGDYSLEIEADVRDLDNLRSPTFEGINASEGRRLRYQVKGVGRDRVTKNEIERGGVTFLIDDEIACTLDEGGVVEKSLTLEFILIEERGGQEWSNY